MDSQLPQGFAAHQNRVAIARFVQQVNPRDLMAAILEEWPVGLGMVQALAHARALVDKMDAIR